MDPSRLRLVVPMHLAETREQANANVRFGLERISTTSTTTCRASSCLRGGPGRLVHRERIGVIGTPDDAIARIERLEAKQGEFGAVLLQANNWADWEADEALLRALRALRDAALQRGQRSRAPPPTNGPVTTGPSSAPSARPPPRPCSTSTNPNSKPPVRRATPPLPAALSRVAKHGKRGTRGTIRSRWHRAWPPFYSLRAARL